MVVGVWRSNKCSNSNKGRIRVSLLVKGSEDSVLLTMSSEQGVNTFSMLCLFWNHCAEK